MGTLQRALAAATATSLATGLAVAGTDRGLSISQIPLVVAERVAPNLLLIMDDSASMEWETLISDGVTLQIRHDGPKPLGIHYVFPPPRGVYGPEYTPSDLWYAGGQALENTGRRLPDFGAGNGYAALYRSPQLNRLYYDPAVTYSPWVDPDRELLDHAPPAAAPYNPMVRNGATLDLTTEQPWQDMQGQDIATLNPSGEWVWGSGTYHPATYYWWTGPGEPTAAELQDPSNFERVEIRQHTAPFSGHGRDQRSDCTGGICSYEQEIRNFANWFTYHRSRLLASRAAVGRSLAEQGKATRIGFGLINEPGTILKEVQPFSYTHREAVFGELYSSFRGGYSPLRRALDDAGRYYGRTDDQGPWSTTPAEAGGKDLSCRRSYTMLVSDGHWTEGSAYGARPGAGDTLGEIARHHWETDLRQDLDNNVPITRKNPADWQHMATLAVGLGLTGRVDGDAAMRALRAGETYTPPGGWPDPTHSEPAKVDDMLRASIEGRGGIFSTSDPDLPRKLVQALMTTSDQTAGSPSIAANSPYLQAGSRLYQGRFNAGDGSGELLAHQVKPDGGLGDVLWDAGMLINRHDRNIITHDGSGGVPFQWDDISDTQRAMLDARDGLGRQRLAYIRGDMAYTLPDGARFRERSTLLGSIVNSQPAYMDNRDFGFATLPEGRESQGADGYQSYRRRKHTGTLFVGANAGMLHAFDGDTGKELFAYVPAGVYAHLHELTSPDYSHRYYMDGSPRVVDAHLNGEWRTVLVASTGAGGRSVFALDVTEPERFGPEHVLWEFNHPELGYAMNDPTVIRLSDARGTWAVAFGNGYNSESQTARLFMLDLATGEPLPNSPVDTGAGGSGNSNGLSHVVPVDMNGNRITDVIYAGDLLGNLWKFEPATPDHPGTAWTAAYSHQAMNQPLFRATDPGGTPQPITSRPAVGPHPDGGVMVYFGTGKFFEAGDNLADDNPQLQTLYGVRDTGARITGPRQAELQEQTIIAQEPAGDETATGYRVISMNPVDYARRKGWYLDLRYQPEPADGERVISQPLLSQGRVTFVSHVPADDPCQLGGSSWLMELDAVNGGRISHAVFDLNTDGHRDDDDAVQLEDGSWVHASGRQISDLVGTPITIRGGFGTAFRFMSGASGELQRIEGVTGMRSMRRQSWEQLQ